MPHTKKISLPIVNVLIIDDHKMIRDGLKVMLGSYNKTILFKIIEAENGEEALKKIARHQVDIVLADYQMPGLSGAETVQRMLRFNPSLKILAISNHDELSFIQNMMDAGANGYVLKNIGVAELLNAIKTILDGKAYYCSEIAVKLIDAGNNKGNTVQLKRVLTNREMQVLRLIAMEMTNDEIALNLVVAKRTVDTHRQNLLNKLQVKNTAGLVKIALKLNLVGDGK